LHNRNSHAPSRKENGPRKPDGGRLAPARKLILAFHFSPNEKTFHIVVRMKDVPGAASEVLSLLSDRIDLIGSQTYSLPDGKAVWNGFARALSRQESGRTLKRLLASSPIVEACEVRESDRGLLVDSYHSGLESGPGRRAVMMPLAGFTHMFDRLVRDFGTGGETILFEEGSALGKSSGEYLNSHLPSGSLDWKTKALVTMFRAVGYGDPHLKVLSPGKKYSLLFRDCFECSGAVGSRKECGFFRGQLSGTISTLANEEFDSEEVECRLRGATHCQFVVASKRL
jgi:predicted hydrocarbon binding protein